MVVVATGGRPNPGHVVGGEHLAGTWDILRGDVAPAESVLLYDDHGDHQAPSCAEVMAQRGSRVELVTPDRAPLQAIGHNNFQIHMREMHGHQVVFTPDTRLTEVYPEGNRLVAVLRNRIYRGGRGAHRRSGGGPSSAPARARRSTSRCGPARPIWARSTWTRSPPAGPRTSPPTRRGATVSTASATRSPGATSTQPSSMRYALPRIFEGEPRLKTQVTEARSPRTAEEPGLEQARFERTRSSALFRSRRRTVWSAPARARRARRATGLAAWSDSSRGGNALAIPDAGEELLHLALERLRLPGQRAGGPCGSRPPRRRYWLSLESRR